MLNMNVSSPLSSVNVLFPLNENILQLPHKVNNSVLGRPFHQNSNLKTSSNKQISRSVRNLSYQSNQGIKQSPLQKMIDDEIHTFEVFRKRPNLEKVEKYLRKFKQS